MWECVAMLTENIVEQTIKALTDVVAKTNEINKRLTISNMVTSLIWAVTLCVIMGFYFIGQGYPDTSQSIENTDGVKVEQSVTKGGDR